MIQVPPAYLVSPVGSDSLSLSLSTIQPAARPWAQGARRIVATPHRPPARAPLDRLILLIPWWEGCTPIQERSESPRKTSNSTMVETPTLLDINASNREGRTTQTPHSSDSTIPSEWKAFRGQVSDNFRVITHKKLGFWGRKGIAILRINKF